MDRVWSDFYNNHGRFYLLPHADLIKFISICRKKRFTKILDLGCGSGRNIVKLAEEGFNVTGIDFSPSAAQLAEKWLHQKGLDGDIVVSNFDTRMKELQANMFEGIIAVNSLEYGEDGELDKNLREIKRLIKPEGIVFIVYRSVESTIKHPEVSTQFLSEEQLKNKIGQYFRIIEFKQDKDKNFVVIAEKVSYI